MFLLARSSPLFEFAPYACATVTVVGAITTLFAGTIGLVQNDFKSIIAYSTCSQLGYMVTICGLSNYNVGLFHLWNHAFFKALLFLTAGAVIHSLANQQDIRKFGGLQQILVFSYTCLLIGTLALVGTPFLTGFYSKDVILELAQSNYSLSANFSYLLTCFSVLTTSYYSFRLLFMTFNTGALGKTSHIFKPRTQTHDAAWPMALVLIILAFGSVYAGWFFKPMFIGLGSDFWNNSISISPSHSMLVEAEFLPVHVKLLPLAATFGGALLAYGLSLNLTTLSYSYALALAPGYAFLNQRWHYDKLLNEALAYPSLNLGLRFIKVFDKGLLELLPIFGLALPNSLKALYLKLGATQSGLIYHYANVMIFSALCALTLLSFTGGPGFLHTVQDSRLALLMAATTLVL